MSKALSIARTEGQRALNAASLANAQGLAGQGFKVQKEWLSTLEVGGNHRHGALDGQRVDLDKDFVSPSGVRGKAPGQLTGGAGQNANCMCTTMTIIDDQGLETRVGINPNTGEREVISYAPYSEWVKQF